MTDAALAASPDAGACLALHGLGGGPYELSPLIGALRSAALEVEAPAFPGHEGPGPRMPHSTWPGWCDAAMSSHARLSDRHGRVDVVGFSTGAMVALRLAARRPVRRLVLLSPFVAVRHRWYFVVRPELALRTLGRWVPSLPRRPSAVLDPRLRAEVEAEAPFRTFSLVAARSALDLIARTLPEVPRVDAPTLLIQPRRDTVVDPAGAPLLLDLLGTPAPDKRLEWLDRSDHLSVRDLEADAVIARVLDFLRSPR